MMIHKNILLLIFLVVIAVVVAQNPKRKPDAPTDLLIRVKSETERTRMKQYLEERSDPGIINDTIILEDGEEVHCVDKYQQMGRGTLLKIARPPSIEEDDDDKEDPEEIAEQVYGRRQLCPDGTVPRRKVTIEELERFETLEEYFQKLPGDITVDKEEANVEKRSPGPTSQHQYAVYYQYVTNYGAESILNLWSPYTELPSEFSLSQIWVTKGSGSDLETVEAGWQIYRNKYGDNRSRLFIYFTPDNYGRGLSSTAGCYNLDCNAFVQVDHTVYIGGGFDQYSTIGGSQREFKLKWQQSSDGNWWLKYRNTWVGYYPASKFDSKGLRNGAEMVEYGGEIIDNRYLNLHTATDMGSGRFPSDGFGYACYQRAIVYIAGTYSSPLWYDVSPSSIISGSACYSATTAFDSSTSWRRYFYFGGQGYHSTNCY
jgi:hypothetical protein